MTISIHRDFVWTHGLRDMLQNRHDDGQPELTTSLGRGSITVLRADGSELSETEALHVRATLAAHAVAPL